jgi:hypothetical protein
MISSPTFVAPFAKIERTTFQINDLNLAIKSFFEATPYEIVSEVDVQADEEIWRFRLKGSLPNDFAVRTGEIFHNLRSALDQMLAEVVVRVARKSEDRVEFPFGLGPDEFKTALRKQKKLPADASLMIEELRPYKGGDPLLWLLHSTNRRDKHRMGLVPINLRTGGKNSFLSTWHGQALIVGSRHGQHLVCPRWMTPHDYLRLAVEGRPSGLYGLCLLDRITGLPVVPTPDGSRIVYENSGSNSAEGSFEFLTTTPGTKFKTDFEPSFDVAFRHVEGLEHKPIVDVLMELRNLVASILLKFRDRFFLT